MRGIGCPTHPTAVDFSGTSEDVTDPACTTEHAIENIDVGGPAMLRAGAKNHAFVTVVTSPRQYDRVIQEMDQNAGATLPETRAELAAAAFCVRGSSPEWR